MALYPTEVPALPKPYPQISSIIPAWIIAILPLPSASCDPPSFPMWGGKMNTLSKIQ